MANPNLFSSQNAPGLPPADTVNAAGGSAYAFGPEHALAQLAVTGTFNATCYGSAADQLDAVRCAADGCSPTFLAQAALYARQRGHMKDMPAALCVMLSKADPALLDLIFERVIDNGGMLRTFVQLIRSGAFGRRSLGSGPKRLLRRWLAGRSDAALFRASVGNAPSLADVIKLVHPKPATASRRALYAYLLGRDHDPADLPQVVQDFEAFKAGASSEVPNVDFRMLTSLPLTPEQWAQVALRGRWTQTRMNLMTYERHGVFALEGMPQAVAKKLADREAIQRARVFPYQLLIAYLNATEVPGVVREALQDALEVATENVPSFGTPTQVVVDVSGSMASPVTGYRRGSTTKVRCVDVAALVGASILRANRDAQLLAVDTKVHPQLKINPRDTILTNAQRLASFGGGGTDLAAALRHLNAEGARGGLIVIVSDNESWVDGSGNGRRHRATELVREFDRFRSRNRGAKLVCVDLQPYGTTQAPDAPEGVLNVGGFSDAVFDQIRAFVAGELSPEHWVGAIKSLPLSQPAANLDAAG